MKKLHGPRRGVLALLLGAAAGGACGGRATGDYDDGTGRGGRGGQGGMAMAGASGRGGSAMGGQGSGGSASVGGNAGAAGASMGGASGMDGLGRCSSPVVLGSETELYSGHVERGSENVFDACPGNGPEQVMLWTPPTSGRYLLDTFGSAFDTVLYVSSDLSCPPAAPNPQLECNDDFRPNSLPSVLGVQAVAGRAMLIVVDSYNSSGGDFTLRIRGESQCPMEDLGAQLGLAVYTTFDFDRDARLLPPGTECRRGGDLGRSFVWQAPATGAYRFISSADFPSTIALRESCEGAVLACESEGDITNISVTRSLMQGQEVVIEVTLSTSQPPPPWGPLALSIEPL